MELAALASAAIPDLSPTGVVGSPDDPRDFSAAVVFDRQGNRWRVRSPLHEEAAMRLETELQVLSGFTAGIRAGLPFRVPSVAGAVRLDGMRTFVYHDMPGAERELDELTELGGKATEDIGRVIAAVHALPAEVVENADLPVYTADQFRQRRLNELDQAATTGRIPSVLLRRWENALEEMELWDFTPVVAHGDLHEDNLLVDQGRLVSVTGWTDLHIGDPAEDFAWLASSGNQAFTDRVVAAYWQHRSGGAVQDEHLLRRAVLAAEFALAQWLVRGLAAEDEDMSAEAEAMLGELQADVEEHGGQEISAAPSGPHAVPAPATPPGSAPTGYAHADDAPEGTAEDSGQGDRAPAATGPADAQDDDAVIVARDAEGAGEETVIPEAPTEPGQPEDPQAPDPADEDDETKTVQDAENPDGGTADEEHHTSAHEAAEVDEEPSEADADAGATAAAAEGSTPARDAESVEPLTTALDLDEVRRLDIRRPSNPS